MGDVAHPMEEKHYIEWIEVIVGSKAYRQFLKPGEAPEATFCLDADQVIARLSRRDVLDGLLIIGSASKDELTPASDYDLVVGEMSPEITGKTSNGNPIKLSDYRGKVVLLDFWGDW